MDLERARREWEQSFESRLRTAVILTSTLRDSNGAEWVDARERLKGEGVDVQKAAMALLHTSGEHSDTAVVATPEGRVFVFDILYDYGPSGERLEEGVRCTGRWKEVTEKAKFTERWKLPNVYLEAVLLARRLHETKPDRPAT